MTTPTSTQQWTWPADVLAFADEQGVRAYLDPVLEMTRQLLPGRLSAVEMAADYELPNERCITFWADINGLTVVEIGDVTDRWYAEVRQLVSRARASCFHLGMHG
jgi:DNA-directed RNA polymerase specialized sigma24 family protein